VDIKVSRVSPPTPAAPSVAMDGAVQQVLVGPTADDETLASPTPQPPATPVAPPTVINLLVGGELQPPANQESIAPGPLPPVEAALVGADLRRRHLRPLWIRLSRPSRCPASVTADPSPPVASPTRVVRARPRSSHGIRTPRPRASILGCPRAVCALPPATARAPSARASTPRPPARLRAPPAVRQLAAARGWALYRPSWSVAVALRHLIRSFPCSCSWDWDWSSHCITSIISSTDGSCCCTTTWEGRD